MGFAKPGRVYLCENDMSGEAWGGLRFEEPGGSLVNRRILGEAWGGLGRLGEWGSLGKVEGPWGRLGKPGRLVKAWRNLVKLAESWGSLKELGGSLGRLGGAFGGAWFC